MDIKLAHNNNNNNKITRNLTGSNENKAMHLKEIMTVIWIGMFFGFSKHFHVISAGLPNKKAMCAKISLFPLIDIKINAQMVKKKKKGLARVSQ